MNMSVDDENKDNDIVEVNNENYREEDMTGGGCLM